MSAELNVAPRPVPLYQDATGRWRMRESRIPLERVVQYHQAGATPEAIVDAFDTLRLADVYAVVGFYLDNKEAVDDYIRYWDARADEVEKKIREDFPARPGLKE